MWIECHDGDLLDIETGNRIVILPTEIYESDSYGLKWLKPDNTGTIICSGNSEYVNAQLKTLRLALVEQPLLRFRNQEKGG